MLSLASLTPDQQSAITRLYDTDATVLVAATGVGKTAICLTAVEELIAEGFLRRVIVACPAKVVPVWRKEADKWAHTQNLKIWALTGDAKARSLTLRAEADIYVVSLNNLDWLLQQDHGCDGIIIDELSKAAGKQAKKLKSKKFGGMLKWRVGMTATPVSQDFQKLFPMCRIIDHGQALGTNKQKFMERYFYSDYMGYNWTLRDGADAQIMARVAPLVHLVHDDKVAELPPLFEKVIRFDMPPETREIYNEMKKHMVAGDVEAANEAVKSGKLRQIASGFLYNDAPIAEGYTRIFTYDTARRATFKHWAVMLDGKPGLVFYEFVYQEIWNDLNYPNITFAQINSMSHGVDGLQHEFADVLFIQPVWSRDAHEQAIGRVWRKGQTKPVTVTTLVCNDTLDDLVMARVEDRGEWMKIFKQHLEKE